MNALTIFFRIISSIMGGLLGGFFMFMIYLFNIYLLGNIKNPITTFVLIIMIFIGSIIANLSTGVFFSLSHPEKYSNKSTMLWHAFIINMFLFLISFPFYTILDSIQNIAILQLLFSALATNIIYELFSGEGTYTLTGLYGSFFGIFVLFVIINFIQNTLFEGILLFILLPFLWLILSIFTIITEYLYLVLFRIFGVPFLDPKMKL